ncbi:transposase, IS605 family domain protein [Escherichia coli 2845650]|nr:transposase, IS605 family domain protein [Escherichia coli 2845650]
MRQYPSSANTLNNSKYLVRWKTAPYIPTMKDGILRRTGLIDGELGQQNCRYSQCLLRATAN